MSLLVINWPLSSLSGYGIYGLQILMQYIRRGGHFFALTDHVIPPIVLPPPFDAMITPLLDQSCAPARLLDENPREILRFDAPVLHGIGTNFQAFKNNLRVKGRPNVGCAAFEQLSCPAEWREYLKIFDMFISISRWNDSYLRSLDLAPVHLCHQGIDTSLFYPPPPWQEKTDRFAVFSGGKFEFRKGQDIVLAAFKKFYERHNDALLIASWQNRCAPHLHEFLNGGVCASVPAASANGEGLEIAQWLISEGLPENSFKALPLISSSDMGNILRHCDVAVFPSRCEGGTNLVAMEAMACGVPTYVSNNTGHKDLVDLIGCKFFARQGPVIYRGVNVEGWGESDVEEVLDALETSYADAAQSKKEAREIAEKMKPWDWSIQNEKLLKRVFREI